ncbi:Plant peroxidase [Macleaya cordata]|uniref:peroxidase n=1 Tax=Macleaya cordata TaxID=56857 RepID=A0A200QKV3_MACCD|nr:Plant peroxidase [Macleaya cordata]
MGRMGYSGIVVLVVFGLLGSAFAQLKMGFYDQSCPKAEKIVLDYVNQHIPNAPSVAAALLRMHFHDCFVRGCDASLLLNSTSNNKAEKDAPPNLTIRAFDFIDRVKSLVEAACPGVVSCADVLSLAARDSVVVTGGPSWKVPTGRRDGRVSNASEALSDIPSPFSNFTTLRTNFANKGLNVKDLVLLSGGHTIGVSHCSPSFSNRLYNFTGVGDQDPSLDSEYAANLKANKCRTPTDNTTIVEMDPGSFKTFDLSYYQHLVKRRGLFTSDAALLTDSTSRSFVTQLLQGDLSNFFKEFAESMEKMGRIGVNTGSSGEIRKQCAMIVSMLLIQGCDGSVLLNSTSNNRSEKEAPPNLTLQGYDFIDRVKALLEAECPGVVSCADVVALVARDSVVITGGPTWKVPTGRRDGRISNRNEAARDIPAPFNNFTALRTSFANKGLNVKDLVLLSGAHTIGISHCTSFSNRLYNFTGRGDQDPSLDSEYADNLKAKKCKTATDNTTLVEMDPGSFRTFDLSYYKLLLKRRGLFESDAALITDSTSRSYITKLLKGDLSKFFKEFGKSMEKMGQIDVKTGSSGEIRKQCAVVNN